MNTTQIPPDRAFRVTAIGPVLVEAVCSTLTVRHVHVRRWLLVCREEVALGTGVSRAPAVVAGGTQKQGWEGFRCAVNQPLKWTGINFSRIAAPYTGRCGKYSLSISEIIGEKWKQKYHKMSCKVCINIWGTISASNIDFHPTSYKAFSKDKTFKSRAKRRDLKLEGFPQPADQQREVGQVYW